MVGKFFRGREDCCNSAKALYLLGAQCGPKGPLFHPHHPCKVLTWASSVRQYSRSACSSACNFLTRPSKRRTSAFSLATSFIFAAFAADATPPGGTVGVPAIGDAGVGTG